VKFKKLKVMFMVPFLFILTVSFLATDTLNAGEDKIIRKTDSHHFRLTNAPSKHDAYSIHYPITVEGIGKIRVIAHVKGGKIKGKKPFKLWIVDARGIKKTTNVIPKKYIKKVGTFKKKGKIDYPVDSGMLYQTDGKFVVILSNRSTKSQVSGEIAIMYSAKEKKKNNNTNTDGKKRRRRH